MTLDELFRQQERDIKAYETVRDKTWLELRQRHVQITESFGGYLPEDQQKVIDREIDDYKREWSMYTGETHRALVAKHKLQRENLLGKAAPLKHKSPQNQEINPLSERQENLKKIIAQQQAIRQRTQEKKRKR